MKKLTGLSVFIVLLLIFSSCGKYEDGPAFSLRTKKMRATGEWEIDKMLVNGEEQDGSIESEEGEDEEEFDMDIDFSAMTFELKSDNSASISLNAFGMTFSDEGKWEFTNNKEDLRIYDFDGIGAGFNSENEITRLTNSEMWLVDRDGSDEVELRLVKK